MDWNASRYHAVSDPQFEWGRRVLQRLAPKPGERILDLGCGTGRLTTMLLETMGQGTVVGLDLLGGDAARGGGVYRGTSAGDGAARRVEDPSHLSYVLADGAALPFADAFDAVFSTAALHWMPDHAAVFASVYCALAPGGRFVAQCGGGPNLARLFTRAADLTQAPGSRPHFGRLAASVGVRGRSDDDDAARAGRVPIHRRSRWSLRP